MENISLKTITTLKFSSLSKTYSGLVALHVPRQEDYLELMAKLVEDYEHETMAEPTPVKGIETVKFLLAENDLTGHDLGHIIGVDRSIAYRILKGTRNLTVDHIKKLSARFAVSADLLLA